MIEAVMVFFEQYEDILTIVILNDVVIAAMAIAFVDLYFSYKKTKRKIKRRKDAIVRPGENAKPLSVREACLVMLAGEILIDECRCTYRFEEDKGYIKTNDDLEYPAVELTGLYRNPTGIKSADFGLVNI
jgi:hypothetical protein